MFKSLSRKILLSNIILNFLVLLGAFAGIYNLSYSSNKNQSIGYLRGIVNSYTRNEYSNSYDFNGVKYYNPTTSGEDSNYKAQAFFVLTVDKDGNILIDRNLVGNFNDIVDRNGNIIKPEYIKGDNNEIGQEYKELVKEALKDKGMDKVHSFNDRKIQKVIMTPMPSNDSLNYPDSKLPNNSQINISEPEVSKMKDSNYYQIFFLDVTENQRELKKLVVSFVWIVPLALIPMYLISFYIMRKATKPIEKMLEKQRQFVADASHELKTPLAIMSSNTEAILSGDGEDNKQWLSYIRDEVDRMTSLVKSLLDLSRAEEDTNKESHASFDISNVVLETATLYEVMAFEKGIDLKLDVEKDLFIKSNEAKIRRVASALLDNAVKYTNENGFIRVSLSKSKGMIVIEVENSGKGLTKEELPHIFEKFYRADKSRLNEDESFGLGLSIVESLVKGIGGKIEVKSTPNESTTFTVLIR